MGTKAPKSNTENRDKTQIYTNSRNKIKENQRKSKTHKTKYKTILDIHNLERDTKLNTTKSDHSKQGSTNPKFLLKIDHLAQPQF